MDRPIPTYFCHYRRVWALIAAVATASLVLLTATASQAARPSLVNPVPSAVTPSINDGTVFSIAQAGGKIIVGGTFTNASQHDSSLVFDQADALAFDATTGDLDTTGFRPTINGEVNSVVAGPSKDEVYIAGSFTKVDGHAMRVALLDTDTGKLVAGWSPPAIDRTVTQLVLANGRLFVGGVFKKVGKTKYDGLVALTPRTGTPTSYVNLGFTGHHNYRRQCDPSTATCATGQVGVRSIAVNPAGTRLVVTGDFTTAGRIARDQVALIDLGSKSATVDDKWATLAYSSKCFANSFDAYVRQAAFSPDGRYFVIVATGGVGTNSDGTDSSCDAADRFNATDKGTNVRPQWVAYTGEDSLWSVAITNAAIYVGGHERWLNNPYGMNVAGPGAVPRPGLAALDPSTGLPFAWNPGKNPRGSGVFALLPTAAGLWTGSDTNYIGNRAYLRPKVAFFPLAGGSPAPTDATPHLPGRVFEVGATASGAADPDRFAFREFDGTESGQEITEGSGGWSGVRGAFYVDGELFYGKPDGNLYDRSFNGTNLGAETLLDPWNDPTWDNVDTGSGQTYQGEASSFRSDLPTVSSMFYLGGRLYYTLKGVKTMFWRTFEPDTGLVGAEKHTLTDAHDWSNVAGAVVTSHSQLYFADQTSGKLMTIRMTSTGATGSATVADSNTDWASRGLVLLSQSDAATPTPTARFTSKCAKAGSCRFTATPWSDPDGGAVRYAWSFGDGSSRPGTTGTSATHQYAANGDFTATLTVTSTAGASATATQPVTIDAPVRHIAYVAGRAATTRSKAISVAVPKQVHKHDGLVLTVTTTGRHTPERPKGWKRLGATHHNGLTSVVFDRAATHGNLRAKVRVKVRKHATTTAILVAYRNLSPLLVERHAARSSAGSRLVTTPRLHRLTTGTLVLVEWSASATRKLTWRLPRGTTRYQRATAHRKLYVNTIAGDHKISAGRFVVVPAKARFKTKSAVAWSIALSPALA